MATKPPELGEIWREADVAACLGVKAGTLQNWRARGKGPRWFRLGPRRIAYLRSDVEAWLAEQYEATA